MKKTGEKFLLLRHGGMGDNMFLTPIARRLTKLGYTVDVSTTKKTAPLFENNPDFNKIFRCERFGAIKALEDGKPANLFLSEDGVWLPDLALYRHYKPATVRPWRPYNVANYFKSIEGCSLHPELSRTQISNYSNIYDNNFAWAGLDPSRIPDDEKRPVYFVARNERKWAKSILSKLSSPPILLQTFSSSPAKSFSPVSLHSWLKEKGEHILCWDPAQELFTLDGMPLEFPDDIPSIRCTAALVEMSQFCITADTCVAHLAEALNIPHITFYTIVPAWTISKYYKYEITVDSTAQLDGQPCKCYQIIRDCPRKAIEAKKRLPKRDAELLAMVPGNHPVRRELDLPPATLPEGCNGDPMSYFKVSSPAGLESLIDAAVRSYNSALMETAYCLESIDLLKVLKENYEQLKGRK
ncbi:MAG: glycosyltransferase family 9 protein [Nanoarchaeota archaeon]|nr:glycosyltransferase family 9 protein [Nanoarchaeota archaeon]